jgi:hypothetical protein
MSLEAGRRMLSCSYCGNRLSEYSAVMDGALAPVEEQDFFATLPTAKAHRWELTAQRMLSCQGCGATFTLPPARVSGKCSFCESPHVIQAAPGGELIQPEGILLFQFDDQAAVRRIRDWLKEQRFRPGDLDKKAATVSPRCVYLPFWTFDMGGEVKWHCLEKEGTGKYAQWVPRNGSHIVLHDDLLVPATHSLPIELLSKLVDFDTTHDLLPYSDSLLADRPAEIYQIPMADASLVARQRAFEQAKAKIRLNLFKPVRDFSAASAEIAITSYKLVLLPVWVAGYGYQNTNYPLLVNGQTGSLVGDVPRSGVQKVLAGIFGKG